MSVLQYHTARHMVNVPRTGFLNFKAVVRKARFPVEVLLVDGINAAEVPLPAWWAGAWYGDGTHLNIVIANCDRDLAAIRGKLEQIVDEYNAIRRAWAALLKVGAYEDRRQRSHLNVHGQVRHLSIVSTVRGRARDHWNRVTATMRTLDMIDIDKRYGIPLVIRQVSQEDQAALLAALVDSDETKRNHRTAYRLTQSVAHQIILKHAREVAVGLGIAVSPITTLEPVAEHGNAHAEDRASRGRRPGNEQADPPSGP